MNNKSYFSEPFCRNMAWIDLLLLANHDKNFFWCRGIKIDVNRGQIGWGIEEFSYRWKWSRGKVERFLKALEKEGQIIRQKNNVTTLITILNYNKYQANDKTNDKANGQQMIKQTDINNNVNNEDKWLNTVKEEKNSEKKFAKWEPKTWH